MTADTEAMQRYERARDELAARLLALEPLLASEEREPLTAARERLARGNFVLAVVGEFSSGKSFLLNALLGKYRYESLGGREQIVGLLATDINPSTATITELQYATDEAAFAHHDGGRVERIPLDRLSQFVAVAGSTEAGAIHSATQDERAAPSRVVVHTDSAFLQRGFVVADTPGLASVNPAHRRVTLQFLPTADAVLYLIDTQQPFSEGDASFLGIIRQHIESIFIVQTKIDLWQQTGSDGVPAWRHAYDRISQLAAVHAPGTYVYALSARQFVSGKLSGDAADVQASRFEPFLSALDASLVRTTGRGRLKRARDVARAAAAATTAQLERDIALLDMPEDALRELHARRIPEVAAAQDHAKTIRVELESARAHRNSAVTEQGAQLAGDAEKALTQALDTADIARIRDRARLHILVDRTLATVVDESAQEIASQITDELSSFQERAESRLPLRFSLAERAARRFGAEPGAGIWTGDVCNAIASTIVLEAIGGPAISLVHEISSRFASAPHGAYMKRELTADLREHIFPALSRELRAFVSSVGERLTELYDDLCAALDRAIAGERDAKLNSIERILEAHAGTFDAAEEQRTLRGEVEQIAKTIREADDILDPFLAHDEEIETAQTGPEAIRRAHVPPAFDREAYGRGLRPQRYRVAILGALRRGKSSLINAFAGRRVLGDETAGAFAFPVHVRYGDQEAAYALERDGQWREVEIESALQEATHNPVLITTPWKLPRELVLVHSPAFDTGDPMAEDLSIVSASNAAEVLCLFSRQLSDRELALFERVAELGKPMQFVHTLADNETSGERRHVVELAKQYLQEHKIDASRIFTVSTLEYAQAKRDQRAPAPWNEVDALISTIEAHAESHMARLLRLERAAEEQTATPRSAPATEKRSFLTRLFGR